MKTHIEALMPTAAGVDAAGGRRGGRSSSESSSTSSASTSSSHGKWTSHAPGSGGGGFLSALRRKKSSPEFNKAAKVTARWIEANEKMYLLFQMDRDLGRELARPAIHFRIPIVMKHSTICERKMRDLSSPWKNSPNALMTNLWSRRFVENTV